MQVCGRDSLSPPKMPRELSLGYIPGDADQLSAVSLAFNLSGPWFCWRHNLKGSFKVKEHQYSAYDEACKDQVCPDGALVKRKQSDRAGRHRGQVHEPNRPGRG